MTETEGTLDSSGEKITVVLKKGTSLCTPIKWLFYAAFLVFIVWIAGWVVKANTWVTVNDEGDTVLHKNFTDTDATHWLIGTAVVLPVLILLCICSKILENPRHCCCGPSGAERKRVLDRKGGARVGGGGGPRIINNNLFLPPPPPPSLEGESLQRDYMANFLLNFGQGPRPSTTRTYTQLPSHIIALPDAPYPSNTPLLLEEGRG